MWRGRDGGRSEVEGWELLAGNYLFFAHGHCLLIGVKGWSQPNPSCGCGSVSQLLLSFLQISVRLCEHVTILDTSGTQPRRSFFLEEARSLFKTIPFSLSSLAEVERYWYQLQCISLGTPIVLGQACPHELFIK